MKIVMKALLWVVPAVLLMFSCARDPESLSKQEKEQASVDAWVAKYYPQAQRQGDMYYYIIEGNQPGAREIKDGDWVNVNVVGTNFDGSVFYNSSDSLLARQLGTYTRKTHYVPFKGLMAYNESSFTSGQMMALFHMKEGDSCRVILPSKYAYGTQGKTTNNGFEGSVAISGGQPVVFDMKVVEVIRNVEADEDAQLTAVAADWGLDPGNYLVDDLIYLQVVSQVPANDKNNAGELLPTTSLSYTYYFTTRFLDGFVAGTNVDSVARQSWGVSSTSYTPRIYDRSMDGTLAVLNTLADQIEAEVIQLRYGETVRLAFSSNYGYGSKGFPSATDNPTPPYAVVYPYTPMMMELYINPIWNEEQ